MLNTLFVTADGAYLRKAGETVVVEVDKEKRAQIPLLHLASIVCLGRAMLSPEVMAACAEAGVHIAFFTPSGRFQARVEGLPGGNVLLRREQHRVADDPRRSLALSRSFVIGKVANARQFLLHGRRDAEEGERRVALEEVGKRLAIHLAAAATAETLNVLRGVEGVAARDYFSVFGHLVKRHEDEFRFERRSRRPPLDRMNALLSFGYALLLQDCTGAAAGVGLDPAVGFLHEDRPGRLALALDLMEELRVPVVDRLVVALVNRGQIEPGDVVEQDGGGWRLGDNPRRRFLVAYQEAKQVEVRHAFLDESTTWALVPHLQARLLARTLRGDLEAYPPFAIR